MLRFVRQNDNDEDDDYDDDGNQETDHSGRIYEN
jgi:hypothetical protein